jgi:RimJ/RimL family protein N-acetyltransferase
MAMNLATARLVPRHWLPGDNEPFAELNADGRVMEHFAGPLSREESDALAGRIGAHLDRRGWGLWAVEVVGGEPFVGFVGLAVPGFLAPFTPCVEIGWRLAHRVWGRGYATEAAREVLRVAFDSLGFEEIVSFAVPANRRSIAVMERLGMMSAGEFDHPGFPDGSRLQRHLLYRIDRPPRLDQ